MMSTRRGGVRFRWTHADGKRGVSSICICMYNVHVHVRPRRKLEPIAVTLSSSHAKKLALFWIKISFLDGIKCGNVLSI